MKKQDFLNRLKRENRLKLVEPSKEICDSYLKKAERSIKAAKLLSNEELYEESISTSYYAIYNSITAFLFRIGIKCQNHSLSLILFKKLTQKDELYKIALHAKKEREKKQYFVSTEEEMRVMESAANEVFSNAEDFILEVKLIIEKLNTEDIGNMRKTAESLIK